MSAEPDRCGACGAPRDPEAPAPPAAAPATAGTATAAAAPAPGPAHGAPSGTHCEWCGAEVPDED